MKLTDAECEKIIDAVNDVLWEQLGQPILAEVASRFPGRPEMVKSTEIGIRDGIRQAMGTISVFTIAAIHDAR